MGDVTREFRDSVYRDDGNGDRPIGIDLVLHIPMAPRGKGRPRATVRPGSKHAHIYTPKKTRSYEEDFAAYAARQMPSEKLSGLLRIDVVAFIHRPKRLQRKRDPDGPLYCPKTPDSDNILKSAIDGLARFFEGTDAMVARCGCLKVYAERGGSPRMLVRIRSLEAGDGERQAIQQIMYGSGNA